MIENSNTIENPRLCSSVNDLNLSYKSLIKYKRAGMRKKSNISTYDSPKIKNENDAIGSKIKSAGDFSVFYPYKEMWLNKLKR